MFRQISLAVALVGLITVAAHAAEIEVGAKAPNFTATGTDGKTYSLDTFKGSDVVVLCFTCNQCPVAVAYEDRFIDFTKKYKNKGVTFVALNCNNRSESLSAMKQRAEEKGFNFVYAFDKSGKAAKAYGARVTPHLFIIKDGKVQYRGSFDDNMRKPTNLYVATAVDALLNGKTPKTTSTKAFGCGIKAKN